MSSEPIADWNYFQAGINQEERSFILSCLIDQDALILVQTAFNILGPGPITIKLTSQGGDVQSGLGIIDLIRQNGQVTVEVVGFAESMGAVIVQAAKWRRIHPYSTLMFHWGTQAVEDSNQNNFQEKLKFYQKLTDRCDELVMQRVKERHPNKRKGWFTNKTKVDWNVSAEEALEHGFVDEVIS